MVKATYLISYLDTAQVTCLAINSQLSPHTQRQSVTTFITHTQLFGLQADHISNKLNIFPASQIYYIKLQSIIHANFCLISTKHVSLSKNS